jgi:hypothetical protein
MSDLTLLQNPNPGTLSLAGPTNQGGIASVGPASPAGSLSLEPAQSQPNLSATSQPYGPVLSPKQSKTPILDAVKTLPPVQVAGSLMDGSTYDTNGKQITPPNTEAINQQLNSAQDSAFSQVQSTPGSDLDALRQKANDLINSATSRNQDLTNELDQATTGPNDLRTQADNYYKQLGISDLQDQIKQANEDLKTIQGNRQLNLFNVEDQYRGGGTEGFAKGVDERQQRMMAVQELAANIKLQGLQLQLNSQMDAFKVFTGQSESQQRNQISELSNQLGLNKSDLTAGVNLLNQVRQETQNDEQLGKQIFLGLITNIPGIASQITPQEQALIQQGQIPPTVVAKVGALQTYKDIQAQQQQAKTSQDYFDELAKIAQLSQLYGQNPYLDQIAQQAFQGLQEAYNPSSGGSLVSSSPNPNAVVAGYDLTSYASGNVPGGPASQAANVAATFNKLPQITDTATASLAIQSLKPNSPITGAMVMNAAQQTGVDPRMIIAVMQAETQLGTDGSKGSRQNNFGNVGNTDTLMASGGSKGFATPQDGVLAVAQNLAKRQVSNQSFTQSFSGAANQKYSADVEQTTTGAQWIDLSKYSGNDKIAAQNFARANGVAQLTAQQATALRNVENARSNLDEYQNLLSSVVYSGPVAKTFGGFGLSKAVAGLFGSNPNQSFFDSLAPETAGFFKAVSQLNRINGTEFNVTAAGLPQKTDTVAQAQAKIAEAQRQLDNAEKSILGRYAPDYGQNNQNNQYASAAQALGGVVFNPQR